MKNILLTGLLFLTSPVISGNIDQGQTKSASCATCHGVDGNSAATNFPKLAGQHLEYTIAQLKAFKEGKRENAMMAPMAVGLSNEDMADIAAFYASQPTKTGTTADDDVNLGESIYRGGVTLTNVPACIACHGPTGKGNGPAGFPALAGQHADYTYTQLVAFKKGERVTDVNKMMREAVKLMSEKEMKAVSQYIQGLYK